MNETNLTLERGEGEGGFPPFSARECTQTLTPIEAGSLRRTINGKLVRIGHKGHRKFLSTISCKDKVAPAFEGFWRGTLLKVGCIQTLTQAIPPKASHVQLERDPLEFHVYDKTQEIWPVEKPLGRKISLPPPFPGGFVTYRPLLSMMVKSYRLEVDEWGLTVGWILDLEEE